MTTSVPIPEKILLVWEEVPEATKLFVLDAGSDLAEIALASVGKYIDQADLPDGDPIYQLCDRLNEIDELPHDQIAVGPFSKVVVCGFIM